MADAPALASIFAQLQQHTSEIAAMRHRLEMLKLQLQGLQEHDCAEGKHTWREELTDSLCDFKGVGEKCKCQRRAENLVCRVCGEVMWGTRCWEHIRDD